MPTGIVVSCQEGRSQIENREKCMQMLRTKIFDEMTRRQEEERGQERRSKIGTGERSEKIRNHFKKSYLFTKNDGITWCYR